jgi:hypothetical protein
LYRRTNVAETFNRPAEEFYEWVRTRLASSPSRQLLVQIRHCEATIAAGWPSRDVKTKMTKAMKSARSNLQINQDQRACITARLQKLIGLERRAVNQVNIDSDGRIEVSFTTAAIYEHDI